MLLLIIILMTIIFAFVSISIILYDLFRFMDKMSKEEKQYKEINREIKDMERLVPGNAWTCEKCGKKIVDYLDPCYCWLSSADEVKDLLDE